MLTDEARNQNKLRYMQLLAELNVDLTRFSQYLDHPRMDFFNKPYSTYESGAYAGALCERSLAVYDELVKLCDTYVPDKYKKEDLIMAALFKNLYRGELYEPYYKNQKNDQTGQWEQILAYRNKEQRPVFGDISFSSYMIARKFFDLSSDEVVEAITQSSCPNTVDGYAIRTSYKLVVLLNMAELIVDYLK